MKSDHDFCFAQMEEWLLKRCAERSESSPFCRALVAHLRAGSDVSLYSSAEAFSAFVDNGGNVGLYEQCVRQARQAVEEARITGTFRLLDLGSGTGKLLLPLLEQLAPQLEGLEVRVTLVDAEEGMMEGLRERVKRLLPDSAVVESVKATFGEYVDTCEEEYDICLSSFALHYCVGAERRRVLEWIYDSCQVFLLFEFDVPQEIMDEPIDSESRFDYLVTRFDQGVAEYAGSSVCDLVVNGFLCPVFVLNYREKKPSAEVSAKLWTAEARAAGFEDVEVRAVYSYWWSDCFMLIGRSNASFDPRPFAALDVMQVHDYGVKVNEFWHRLCYFIFLFRFRVEGTAPRAILRREHCCCQRGRWLCKTTKLLAIEPSAELWRLNWRQTLRVRTRF